MCEYCKVDGIIARNFLSIRQWNHGEGEWREIDYDFCPECGEPLTMPKPLTLEDLKEREYKAVYVKIINKQGLNFCCEDDILEGWALVRKSWVRMPNYLKADLRYTDYDFESYGKTWLAYDREPGKRE